MSANEMSLSTGLAMAKEYAIKKPQLPNPNEDGAKISQAASQDVRESGLNWLQDDKAEISLSGDISDESSLLSTSTTLNAPSLDSVGSPKLLDGLKNKFRDIFVSSYSNIFSHNRLLSKVSEWMVGNVMEHLALMGMSPQELEGLKGQVRSDLISQNQNALHQVIYDETMHEVVG